MIVLRGFRQVIMLVCLGMILFLICSCSSNNNDENILHENTQKELITNDQKQTDKNSTISNEIIGIWHASPSIGAGFNNVFFFYKDNKFRLNYSQYDEEKRTLDISGQWVINENKLILSITQKTIVIGGELVDASPSETSKYKIVNGTIEKKKLDPPETIEYNLGQIEKATDSPYESKLLINEEFYWKISDNPDDKYYNEQYAGSNANNGNDNLNQLDNEYETYVNEKYDFSIKYPVSWDISAESPSGDGVVLYNKNENNIRVYGGYLLGDNTDTMEIDEAKNKGLKVDEFTTTNGKKGYEILEKSEDKVKVHFIVYGSTLHCHLYADVLSTFYEEKELLLIDIAKSIDVGE